MAGLKNNKNSGTAVTGGIGNRSGEIEEERLSADIAVKGRFGFSDHRAVFSSMVRNKGVYGYEKMTARKTIISSNNLQKNCMTKCRSVGTADHVRKKAGLSRCRRGFSEETSADKGTRTVLCEILCKY